MQKNEYLHNLVMDHIELVCDYIRRAKSFTEAVDIINSDLLSGQLTPDCEERVRESITSYRNKRERKIDPHSPSMFEGVDYELDALAGDIFDTCRDKLEGTDRKELEELID